MQLHFEPQRILILILIIQRILILIVPQRANELKETFKLKTLQAESKCEVKRIIKLSNSFNFFFFIFYFLSQGIIINFNFGVVFKMKKRKMLCQT